MLPTLRWESRPFAELLRLAWPIAVSTVSYSVMTLVDTLLVGRLGAASLAGVGLGGTAAFALLCFSFGLLRGAKVLVSQAVGAGRDQEVGTHLGAALAAAAVLGLATLAAGQLAALALAHVSATPESGAQAGLYLRLRILAAPLVLVAAALREVRQAQGDARSPMVAAVAANALNVALAWLLVVPLRRGVAGAAWATNVAQLADVALLVVAQWRAAVRPRLPGLRHLAALARLGGPTAVQFLLEVGSFALLASMLAALSEREMAAHQIALQVVHFSFLPAFAVAEAASVLAGQAAGAGRVWLVRPLAYRAAALASAYTGACSLVLVFGARRLVAGFTSEPALAAVAVRLLWVAAVFQVFDGAAMVARGALRGVGDVRYAAGIGIVTSWLATPPLAWLLGWRAGLGAVGGWMGLCVEVVVGAALFWWRLERGRWLSAAAWARAFPDAPAEAAPVAAAASAGRAPSATPAVAAAPAATAAAAP
jgi:MATE family multidrug resistance protein